MSKMTSIIILTYNQLPLTRMCLSSINQYTRNPYQLVLIDNGSTDGTVDYLKRIKGAEVILNQKNRGFAAGVNQGLKLARGDYFLLLNNDTIVAPNWLTNLLSCLNSQYSIGIVGPRTNYAGGYQGGVTGDFSTMKKIQDFSQEFNHHNPAYWQEVDFIAGFCMLIKREVIAKIGFFDEGYQYGMFEDNDFCRRALEKRFKILCAGDTFVYHIGSCSFHQNNLNMALIFARNKEIFEERWGGKN